MVFRKAIVRRPGQNFSDGLSSMQYGRPDYDLAIIQHDAYCAALAKCGIDVIRLEPDERYPDSTFVEDAAVLTRDYAVVMRPGAASRLGEIDAIALELSNYFSDLKYIQSPGTVDAGDVCEAGEHVFIGVSHRTNEAGANQLAKILSPVDYTSSLIDIRGIKNLLHLKSGIAYLGKNQLVVIESLCNRMEFRSFELISVPAKDEYAANCVRINEHVLVAAGYTDFEERLRQLGHQTIALEMSEFQKMDGGLSCLSLRF